MEFLDFEIEVGAGNGRDYPVEVRSPAGEARATMHFPYDSLQLDNHLKDLQIALLRSSGATPDHRRLTSLEDQPVQTFGESLFEALLTGPLRSRYVLSREKAVSEGKGLRLKLRLNAPELAVLPWEFLYDPDQAEYVCLSRNTPLVRHLEIPQSVQALAVKPPLRVLGMISAPKDQPALDTDRERKRVESALKDLRADGFIDLEWLEGSGWRDLQTAMAGGPWHIFHFIGHGGFAGNDGFLALTDPETGNTHQLDAIRLARLLADQSSLRLVLLNSCARGQGNAQDIFASTAATLVRRGIPAVVAMQYEISDQAAIEFSQSFYQAVSHGMPVDAAVAEARKSVSLALDPTFEWGTPVLQMRSPDGVLFKVAEAPEAISTERRRDSRRSEEGSERHEDQDKDQREDETDTSKGKRESIADRLQRVGKLGEQVTATTAALGTFATIFFPQDEAKRLAGLVVLALIAAMGTSMLFRNRQAALATSRGMHLTIPMRDRWPRIAGGLALAMALMVGFQMLPVLGVPFPPWGGGSSGDRLGTWIGAPEMRVSRNEVAGAMLWNRIYVAGTESNGRATGALGEFDPGTGTWQEVQPPQASLQFRFAGMAAAKGKLYLVGGFGADGMGVTTVWTFDPLERRWESAPPLQQGRGSMVVVAANDKIYAIGGRLQLLGGDDVGTAEVFDPDTNRWTALPAMPTPRNHVAGAVVDGKIYAIGGRRGSFSDKEAEHLATVEAYEPATRTWERKSDMAAARSGIGATNIGERIYVFGGEGPRVDDGETKIGIVNQTDVYDAKRDSWMSNVELPTSRHGYAAVAYDGKIYVIGGGLAAGGGVSRVNEVFVP